MAKRGRKKGTRRRRRVGAMAMNASSPMVIIGSIAAGYLGGSTINPLINGVIPADMKTKTGTGKAVALGQVGLGAALVFMKGKKSMVKTIAGGVMIGAGLKRAMIVFKTGTTDTLGGYGQVPVIGAYETNGPVGSRRVLGGYGDVPVIGAYEPNSSLNGAAKVMGGMNNQGGLMG